MGATEELLMSMADEARDSGADEARDSGIAYLNVDPDTRKISVPYSETWCNDRQRLGTEIFPVPENRW